MVVFLINLIVLITQISGVDSNAQSEFSRINNFELSETCPSLFEINEVLSELLGKHLNDVLKGTVITRHNIKVADHVRLQFTAERYKERRVILNAVNTNNTDQTKLVIKTPLKFVNTRVDYEEKHFGMWIKHHEDIKNAAVYVVSTVVFSLSEQNLKVEVVNDFEWISKPNIEVIGIEVSIGGETEPYLKNALKDLNKVKIYPIENVVGTNVLTRCGIKQVVKNVLSSFNRVELNPKLKSEINNYLIGFFNN